MLNNNQQQIVNQYSEAIDKLNVTLGKDIALYTNSVLNKDTAVGDAFERLLSNKSISYPSFLRSILDLCKYYFKCFSFIIFWSIKKIIFNLITPHYYLSKTKKLHIIDIFLISKDIVKLGKFKDRYLSELVYEINNNNINYVYMPCFYRDGYNPIKWFRLYQILKKSKHKFITEFDVLTWMDAIRMVTFSIKYPFILRRFINAHEVKSDIDNAIHCALKVSIKQNTLPAYVRYLMGIKIAKKFNNSKLLSYCENQSVDKCLHRGIKDISNNFKVYAYHQYAMSENYGLTKLPEQNKGFGISPEKIIVTGGHFIPKESNYNYMALSIRYQEVFNTRSKASAENCLVLLSNILIESKRILNLISNLIIKKNRLYIKLHPILDPKVLKGHSEKSILDGNLYQYVPNTNVIITAKSGAALEAVSMGVSVIIINNINNSTINPLIELGRGIIWETVSDAQELNKTYNHLTQNRIDNFDEITHLAAQYRKLFFTKPTEKLMLRSFDADESLQ